MARINLLPWREERRKQRQQEFYVLLGASAVLAILAVFLGLWFIGSQIDAQNERNDTLAREIKALDAQIAEIEELDIHDLRTLKTQVDNADLTLVYENLEQGSRNHLRAFHTNLLRQGASYTPKHITQAEYDAIVLSARETGMP